MNYYIMATTANDVITYSQVNDVVNISRKIVSSIGTMFKFNLRGNTLVREATVSEMRKTLIC